MAKTENILNAAHFSSKNFGAINIPLNKVSYIDVKSSIVNTNLFCENILQNSLKTFRNEFFHNTRLDYFINATLEKEFSASSFENFPPIISSQRFIDGISPKSTLAEFLGVDTFLESLFLKNGEAFCKKCDILLQKAGVCELFEENNGVCLEDLKASDNIAFLGIAFKDYFAQASFEIKEVKKLIASALNQGFLRICLGERLIKLEDLLSDDALLKKNVLNDDLIDSSYLVLKTWSLGKGTSLPQLKEEVKREFERFSLPLKFTALNRCGKEKDIFKKIFEKNILSNAYCEKCQKSFKETEVDKIYTKLFDEELEDFLNRSPQALLKFFNKQPLSADASQAAKELLSQALFFKKPLNQKLEGLAIKDFYFLMLQRFKKYKISGMFFLIHSLPFDLNSKDLNMLSDLFKEISSLGNTVFIVLSKGSSCYASLFNKKSFLSVEDERLKSLKPNDGLLENISGLYSSLNLERVGSEHSLYLSNFEMILGKSLNYESLNRTSLMMYTGLAQHFVSLIIQSSNFRGSSLSEHELYNFLVRTNLNLKKLSRAEIKIADLKFSRSNLSVYDVLTLEVGELQKSFSYDLFLSEVFEKFLEHDLKEITLSSSMEFWDFSIRERLSLIKFFVAESSSDSFESVCQGSKLLYAYK